MVHQKTNSYQVNPKTIDLLRPEDVPSHNGG